MGRFETRKYYKKYSLAKGAAYGAIAGIVAGFVMAPFLMASVAIIGLPADSILIAYGLSFGAQQDNAMTVGIVMHLFASALIGAIFGGITSIVDRLRVTGIGKGIAEGLVTGMSLVCSHSSVNGKLELPTVALSQVIYTLIIFR